jgi:hypothetical protein
MKHVFAFAFLAAILAAPVHAQEATPKPARKSFFFLPGRKVPEPTPEPPVPVAKATPKATPKPTPKATPRTTPKPVVKATPKPQPPPEPKPEAPTGPKPEDKLKGTMIDTVAVPATPPPATPVPKPVATPKPAATPRATPAATPTPAQAAQDAAIKAGSGLVFGSVVPMADRSASPAIITSTVPPEPAQIVRAFFSMLGKGDIDGAYSGLMKGSKIGERPEEVRTLKNKTREAIDLFGTIHGYDLVDLKPVGERLMRATYLSLGHELPLRWRFYLYKAEAEWKLIDLRVDDKLTGIFDESAEDNPRPAEPRP